MIDKKSRNPETDQGYGFQDEAQHHGKYLTFNLGDQVYGIGIENVTEIIGILPITVIPEMPEYLVGIMNLRSRIIPVMDMRLRFRMPYKEYGERTCVIVVEIEESAIGLIVDGVSEVALIANKDIVPQPSISAAPQNRYIKHIGKVGSEVKLLLDCNELLSQSDIDQIEQIN